MLERYTEAGFKFFPCNKDKSPATNGDWRKTENHLTAEQAQERINAGHMVGAWIPDNVIVIDLDTKKGKDGIASFRQVKEDYGIDYDLTLRTFCVYTQSGGLHLFFKVPDGFEPYQRTDIRTVNSGIDTKTSKGYIIAAGSPGYAALGDVLPIAPLPDELVNFLNDARQKQTTRDSKENAAPNAEAETKISLTLLKKILKKIDVTNFASNDAWFAFCASAIAAAGNTPEVVSALETWSYSDPRYEHDLTTARRLRTIKPDGGITVGTFINYCKEHGVSDYFIRQIKTSSIASLISESEPAESSLPFPVDFEELSSFDWAKQFFYAPGNTAAMYIVEQAIKGRMIYVKAEKKFYRFDDKSGRWIVYEDMPNMIFTILHKVIKQMYTDMPRSEDTNKQFMKCLNMIGGTRWKHYTADELKTRDGIFREYVQWDSPSIKETMTLEDGIIDFSGGTLESRAGSADEYRRHFAPFKISDIIGAPPPEKFINFIEGVFPDADTRASALSALSLLVSGNASKKVFQTWVGSGNNGKSTLVEIMHAVLGRNKSITYNAEMLLKNKMPTASGGARPDLAKFQGAYAAFGVEIEPSGKLSTALIKKLTGDDTISARRLFEDEVEFGATWQLIFAANELPGFDSSDKAFLKRLFILPFKVRFYDNADEYTTALREGIPEHNIKPAADKGKLQAAITAERAAILKYLIEQYIYLQTELEGELPRSAESKKEKELLIKENDAFGDFIAACCVLGEGYVENDELAAAYHSFVGNEKVSTKWVTRQARKYDARISVGVKRIIVNDPTSYAPREKLKRVLQGIRLREESELAEIEKEKHLPDIEVLPFEFI